MVVYKLVGRTNPFDWAQMAQDVDLGLFETREAAIKEMDRMQSLADYYMNWAYHHIVEVEVK